MLTLRSYLVYLSKDFTQIYKKERSNYEEKNEVIKNRKKISQSPSVAGLVDPVIALETVITTPLAVT